MSARTSKMPQLSIVVPVKDEADNLRPLIEEICVTLDPSDTDYEIVYIDDGSVDSTPIILEELKVAKSQLRVIRHPSCFGQSTAIVTGVRAARGRIIATLDGDGQNDPRDIPMLLENYLKEEGKGNLGSVMVIGCRVMRKDTLVKRFASCLANSIRRRLLKDVTFDTGCGLKVFSQASFMDLPHFDHMHRFLPALFLRGGGRLLSVPVNHRVRQHGTSKYGIWNRLWVGIIDLLGVFWLMRRSIGILAEEKDPM